MPIIGRVGRKTFKVRFLNTSIHLLLLFGAVTMIYPFMIMVSASFKSNVDSKKFSIIPSYFYDEDMLFKKHIESRMNEESNVMNEVYGQRFLSFEFVEPVTSPVENKLEDWNEFLKIEGKEHTQFDYYLSESFGRNIEPLHNRKFRQLVKKENGNSLREYNKKYNSSVESWDEISIETKELLSRGFNGDFSGILERYKEYSDSQPYHQRVYADIDGYFVSSELLPAFRGNVGLTNEKLDLELANWGSFVAPQYRPKGKLRPYWDHFVKKTVNIHHLGVLQSAHVDYVKFLKKKYDDVSLLNKTYSTNYSSFYEIAIPESIPTSGAMMVDWAYFIETIVSEDDIYIKGVEYSYREWLKNKYQDINSFNETYEMGFTDFNQIELTATYPSYNIYIANEWEHFVRNSIKLEHIIVSPKAQIFFQEYLKEKFPDGDGGIDLAEMNHTYGTKYSSEHNIYMSEHVPENQKYRRDWESLLHSTLPAIFIEVEIEKEIPRWREHLSSKYRTIESLNLNWKTSFTDFESVNTDWLTIDYLNFKENKKSIFLEHLTRNYAMVINEMFYNGRAMLNTLIYVTLAIVAALIVNPLAAYALSRFKIASSYKIILILMLTMAFPPMVMGIPNFLILKRLNMLNTFWALILPGLADGYFIFLLKGFFDSLPQELFESATVDGAGEARIFWQIAMQLSKPIMAVIALSAFNGAYRNFMFAFIVCQDKSMWTMMVSIYQLMLRAAPGVGFAALVIAAIPTFLVFIFFQNIIIKGIVVPTEK